jgi:hypothetical protein
MLHLAGFHGVPFKDLPSHQNLMFLNPWSVTSEVSVTDSPPNLKTQAVIACCPVRAADGYGAMVEWRMAGENRANSEKTLPRHHLDQNKSYIKSPSSGVHPAVYSIGSSFQGSKTAGAWSWPLICAETQNVWKFTTALHEVTGGWRKWQEVEGSGRWLKEVTGGWRKWQVVEGSGRWLKEVTGGWRKWQ